MGLFSRGVLHAVTRGYLADFMEDDDEYELVYLLHTSGELSCKLWRLVKRKYNRIDWENFAATHQGHRTEFQARYHMSEEAFDSLVNILRPDIQVNYRMSRLGSGGETPIGPELIVAATLRFLGGDFPKSIADIFRCHRSSIHRIVKKCLRVIVNSDHAMLAIELPESAESLRAHADMWNERSKAEGALYGVVGAMDGWLCCTNQPKDVDNPGMYKYVINYLF